MVNNLPWPLVPFESLLSEPLRNGIYKKKEFHGRGCKIVNMGELFGHPRLTSDIDMNLVELTDKEKEKSLLETGDLIFARRSLTAEGAGKCTLIQQIHEETTFESSIIRARLDSMKASPEFFYYMFNSPVGKWLLGTILRQTAVAGITGSDLAKLQVPCPPLAVQDHLAEQGRTIDNKITLNRQINQTLEQMAQALFKSWFVDFDPVIDNALDAGNPIPDELQHRAEVRKAVRESEGFKPLPDDVRQLFPDAFEESELGWVPKGWPIQTIKDIAVVTDFVANGSFAALKENVTLFDEPEHALYVRTTDFKSGFDSAKAKYVDKKSYEFLSKSKLLGDEVIISNVGDVGTVFRPPVWLDLPMTLGSNAISVSASELNNYLYFHFSSHKGQKSIDGIVSGSAQQKFNKTGFRALTLVTPDADVIEAFNNRYNPLMLKAISNERNIILMTKLRDTLLPKLISGELRLDEVELAVEQEAVSAEQ